MQKALLFIIWPVGAYVKSAVNYFSGRGDRALLLFFCGFVGLNIAITSDSPDINRYRDNFLMYANYDFDYLIDFISKFLKLENGYYDIGLQLIDFTVSRFTTNYRVYFVILGLIYGSFYSYILFTLSKYYKGIGSSIIVKLIFLVSIFLFFPTQGINQFRFWTAGMCFVTGYLMLPVSKKKGFVLMMVTPLLHVGLGVIVLCYFIHIALKSIGVKYLAYMLPIALFLNIGFSGIIGVIGNYIGGSVDGKIEDYTGDIAESTIQIFRGRIWYAAYWHDIALFGLALVNLTFFNKVKKMSVSAQDLYRFNLVFLFFGLLMRGFWLHFRYFELFIFFQLIFLIQYLYESRGVMSLNLFKRVVIIFVMLLILMIKIPAALQFLMPTLLMTNYITGWFFSDLEKQSIWDMLGL